MQVQPQAGRSHHPHGARVTEVLKPSASKRVLRLSSRDTSDCLRARLPLQRLPRHRGRPRTPALARDCWTERRSDWSRRPSQVEPSGGLGRLPPRRRAYANRPTLADKPAATATSHAQSADDGVEAAVRMPSAGAIELAFLTVRYAGIDACGGGSDRVCRRLRRFRGVAVGLVVAWADASTQLRRAPLGPLGVPSTLTRQGESPLVATSTPSSLAGKVRQDVR